MSEFALLTHDEVRPFHHSLNRNSVHKTLRCSALWHSRLSNVPASNRTMNNAPGRGFGGIPLTGIWLAVLLSSLTVLSTVSTPTSSNAGTTTTSTANAASSGSSSAVQASCETAVAQLYSSLDRSAAVRNAVSSTYYMQGIVSYYNPTLHSIFQLASTTAPYPSCTEKVLSYNVVFTLHNIGGDGAAYLAISEYQNLTVIGSRLQSEHYYAVNTDTAWSGFDVKANSGGTQAVYEAISQWHQATPSYPATGCGSSNKCNIATWVGLTDASMATSGNLEQDGTWATCTYSGGSCSNNYFAWYETCSNGCGGAGAVQCTASNGGAVTISPGDTINAFTIDEAKIQGGSSTLYDFYISDATSNTTCYVTGQYNSLLSSPAFAEFMVENGKEGCSSSCAPLANFGSVSFAGSQIWTSGSLSYINNFYWGAYDMANQNWNGNYGQCSGSAVTNVDYGSGLQSSGDFTLTWDSSQYTPVWTTGC